MAKRFETRTDDLVEIVSAENDKIEPKARFEVSMVPFWLGLYVAVVVQAIVKRRLQAPQLILQKDQALSR